MFVLNFTSFLKLIGPSRGNRMWKMTKNSRVFMASSISQLEGSFEFRASLGFVRERYSLQGGDNDRGKNQEKVIAAIIKKLTSTKVLSNYNEIIAYVLPSQIGIILTLSYISFIIVFGCYFVSTYYLFQMEHRKTLKEGRS